MSQNSNTKCLHLHYAGEVQHRCEPGTPSSLPAEVQHLQKEVRGCSSKIQSLSLKINEQDSDISAMKEELRQLLLDLAETKITLRDIADKLQL